MNQDSLGPGSPASDDGGKSPAESDNDIDSSNEEEAKEAVIRKREDVFVCFSSDKDLRHYESIRVKAQYYTGIAIRIKNITPQYMENITKAIEVDNLNARKKAAKELPQFKDMNIADIDMSQVSAERHSCIENLRIEEARLSNRAVHSLTYWIKNKHLIYSLGLIKLRFDDKHAFKQVLDSIASARKLAKVSIAQMAFDADFHGQRLGQALKASSSIKELSIEQVSFDHPKSFCDMCLSLVDRHCSIQVLKIKGVLFTTLEVKVLQFLIMRNTSITTMDFSECIDESRNNFSIFLQKFDAFSRVKYLSLDSMQPDLHNCAETLAEALSENTCLEVLTMRGNKIRNAPYSNFWTILRKNAHLKKINCSKTELNDKVVEKLGPFLESPTLRLEDIDLSRNSISDVGMKTLAMCLRLNTSLTCIHLEGNNIKSDGCLALSDYLSSNTTLQELNLSGNRINNEGIAYLSQMLLTNRSLLFLDISRNQFNDQGFDVFAAGLEKNRGLEYLDVSKNKDISDEGSLITLAESLSKNRSLRTLDLSGIRLRKPFLKSHLELALQSNITLIDVIGKIPPGTIEGDLGINIKIRDQIYPCYQEEPKIHKRMKFNFTLVDPENYSFLDISGKKASYILPSFKFMNFHNVRAIDLQNTGFHDTHMIMLSEYLQADPELYSICLDNNPFTDDSMTVLANALRKNKKVAHLSILNCPNITDVGLRELYDIIMDHNMVLFQLDIDIDKFDEDIAQELVRMSALNRDIQQKLRPRFELVKVDDMGNETTQNQFKFGVVNNDAIDSKKVSSIGSGGWLGQATKEVKDNTSELSGSVSNAPMIKRSDSTCDYTLPSGFNKYVQRIVNFDHNAPIAECFKSVLKVYRIMQPDTVILEDKGLEDEHLVALVEFLDKKDMVRTLNLRRNNISNIGAIALAEFLMYRDDTLIEVNLNRNRITHAGVERLLDAVHATIRLQKFGISFGNYVSASQAAAFEQEIKANIQIRKNLNKDFGAGVDSVKGLQEHPETAKTFRKMKYEIIDKGQNYMRCAVKTTQLLDILHLSLPDNLLGYADAELIAGMLRKNTSLRILNLAHNNFDANAGRIIGDSLLYNDHLQSLDISYNRLGDQGVRNLLWGLIILGCRKHNVAQQSKDTKLKIDLKKDEKKDLQISQINKEREQKLKGQSKIETAQSVDSEQKEELQRQATISKGKSMISRSGTYEECASTRLEAINLQENYMTQESLRIVWLMLEVNENTILDISKPNQFNWNYEDDDSRVSGALSELDNTLTVQETSRAGLLSQDSNQEDDSVEQLDTEEQQELLKAQKRAECQKKCHDRLINCIKKFTCFNDYNNEFNETRKPKCSQVCCWRFYRSRQATIQFETSDKVRKGLLNNYFKLQYCWFYTNYVLLILCCIMPFVLILADTGPTAVESTNFGSIPLFDAYKEEREALRQEKINKNVMLTLFIDCCLIGYFFLYEFIICAFINIKMQFKCSNNCCFLIAKLMSSTLRRTQILVQAVLAAEFCATENVLTNVFALTLALLLVLSQVKSLQYMSTTVSLNYEKNILTNLERLQRSAQVTGHEAINVLLFKMSIRPNRNMRRQADRLSTLMFEDRSEDFVSKEKYFYKHEADTLTARSQRSCCCKNATVARFCLNYESTRFWGLCCNTIPVACCAFFVPLTLKDTQIEFNHHMIIGILALISILLQIGVLCGNYPILVINGDKVYDIAVARLNEKRELYEDLMSGNPNLDSEPDEKVEGAARSRVDPFAGGRSLEQSDASFEFSDEELDEKETHRVDKVDEFKNMTNETQEANPDFARRSKSPSAKVAKVAPSPSISDANKDLQKLVQVQGELDSQMNQLNLNQTDLDTMPIKQSKVRFSETPPVAKLN